MRVLYVAHNGIGSALVRSQVLPYVRGLIRAGHEIRVVTFERGEPFPEGEFDRRLWKGIHPRRGTSLLAKIADIAAGVIVVLRWTTLGRVQALHARSYLPAAICWLVGALTRRPYVFDMRGFLGEEYLDTGHWSARDLRWKALRIAERWLLQDAAEIVVLTDAAERRLRTDPRYAPLVRGRTITVVPCAVDLERFRPSAQKAPTPLLVYSGSLGTWYLLDAMLDVFVAAREQLPGLRFRILNRGEHAVILAALSRRGLDASSVEIRTADFADVPRLVAEGHVAIALVKQARSKIGSSPIKVAEYLACGLPTLVNAGLGDSDEIIARYGAGGVVPDTGSETLRRAGAMVARLVGDEAAARNARRCAEEIYALERAIERYRAVYQRLDLRLSGRAPAPGGGSVA